MLLLNCIESENISLGQTIDKIDYFIDTIIFSTFRLYTYIKKPPKGAFTHKKRIYQKLPISKPDIFLQGTKLEYVSEFKYLGVTLDEGLTWTPHIKKVAAKATAVMLQVRRMLGKTWGPSAKISRWAYLSLIRPILSYGAIVWLKGLETESNINTLRKVQRMGCLGALRAMSTTPTAGMELMLDIKPIEVHLRSLAISSYRRMKFNGYWRPQPGELLDRKNHSNLVQRFASDVKFLNEPVDKLLYTHRAKSLFSTVIGNKQDLNEHLIDSRPAQETGIFCFTDGSKQEADAGCGYVVTGPRSVEHGCRNLGRNTTVFQAEISAISDAAELLTGNAITNKDITFHIDSQAAIKALDKYETKSILVKECKMKLNDLAQENSVTLSWIPAHVGHPGNEAADKKAKEGTTSEFLQDLPPIPVPLSVVKQEIYRWELRAHRKTWRRKTTGAGATCRQTKMFLPEPDPGYWKKLQKFNRKNLKILTQMITGHSVLKYHLWKMKIEPDPMCEQCQDGDETVEHFICECEAFGFTRQHTFGHHFLKKEDLCSLDYDVLLKYVNATKRFEQ